MRHILTYLLVLLACGCEHHPLYYKSSDMATVRINIDWSKTEITPNGVSAYIYNCDGTLYRRMVPSSNLRYVDLALPEGCYDVVLFNDSPSELRYINFSDTENISTLIATAASKTPIRQPSQEDAHKDIVADPNVLTSAQVNNIVVTRKMIEYHKTMPDNYIESVETQFSAVMERRVVEVNIEARVVNINSVPYAPQTFFKHFSGGFYMGQEVVENREVMHEFLFNNVKYEDTEKTIGLISTKFNSFGKVLNPNAKYVLDIGFVLNDGTDYTTIVDVTDQTEVYMDGNIAKIDIYVEITLPVVIGGGGDTDDEAIGPSVSDWVDIEQTLTM